ncbi:MAG: macro domain-containing protein [Bacteroidetes bacterium]|nr:macro domain-containing protein [Bacteroidota bacterium]
MKEIKYIHGDVTKAERSEDNHAMVVQVVNNIGAYGAGVSGAIAKRWPAVEVGYRNWYETTKGKLPLGEVEIVFVSDDPVLIANLVGQDGIVGKYNPKPVRYDAIDTGLDFISKFVIELLEDGEMVTVHMPRIGCGLAQGEWSEIEPLVKKNLTDKGISVIVYDWP